MNFDEFVGEVQQRAKLASKGDALRATQAVLNTLGERLESGEAKDLASQLPRELAVFLQTEEHAQRMTLDEFFKRVSGRSEVDVPAAVYQVRVIFEVLREAVSPGEISDVRQQLPPEWGELFEVGSQGKIRLQDAA